MKSWNYFSRMTQEELNARLPEKTSLHGQPMNFKPPDKSIGMMFYHNADADGFVKLSVRRLCSDTFYSRQTVKDAIKKLIAAKMLKVVKRGGGKFWKIQEYKIRYLPPQGDNG